MPPSLTQFWTNTTFGDHSNTATATNPVASGALVAVYVFWFHNGITMSVADNKGNPPYVQACFANFPGSGGINGAIFYMWNVTGGAGFTVTATASGGSNLHVDLVCVEVAGILTGADPLDGASAAGGVFTAPLSSGNITTTTANDFAFAGLTDTFGGISAVAPWTLIEFDGYDGISADFWRLLAVPGTYNSSQNQNGGDSISAIAAFKPAVTNFTLSPPGISSAEIWVPGAITYSLLPAGIPSAEAWPPGAVSLSLLPSGIPSAEAWPSAAVDIDLLPPGVPSSEAWPSAGTALGLSPPGIPSAEGFPASIVALALSPPGIPGSEALAETLSKTPPTPVGTNPLLLLGGWEPPWGPDEFAAYASGTSWELGYPERPEVGTYPPHPPDDIGTSIIDFLLSGVRAPGRTSLSSEIIPIKSKTGAISGDTDRSLGDPGKPEKKDADYLIVPVGPQGSIVRAVAAGKVEFVVDPKEKTLSAVVRGDDGNRYLHAALGQSTGKSGRWVRAGEPIGTLDRTRMPNAAALNQLVRGASTRARERHALPDRFHYDLCVSVVFLVVGQPVLSVIPLGALLYSLKKEDPT